MKTKTNFKKGSIIGWSPFILIIKSVILSALILTGIQSPINAQETQYTQPSWWFGVAGGANLNFYTGSTQELNAGRIPNVIFTNGFGAGLYIAPLVEFHPPGTLFGVMLQAGYDGRQGGFDEQYAPPPCNGCQLNLYTELSYITVEPSLRFAPFKSNLYLYAGPRIAFNVNKSFTLKQSNSSENPGQNTIPDEYNDFCNIRQTIISMQIGAGYDFPLLSKNNHAQLVLSPFVSYHPYFGQEPRTIETWDVTTLRVGVALKFGVGHKKLSSGVVPPPPLVGGVPGPKIRFTVNSPKNITVNRRVRETFPLRNYVFFNLGSTEIPDRYVILRKDQVKEFKIDQLEVFKPKNLSGRSDRQMIVYYNILNILGDRMGKDPSTTINLVGSSEQGPEDGRAMAESVKRYLIDIFGIDASRISTQGRDKPKIPSQQPNATQQFDLLREGDRRVSIESSSPVLLMEFQSGSAAPLKPVVINTVEEAPPDSYISFNVAGWDNALSSWSLEIKDEQGKVQNFGPYTREKVSIPGKAILGDRPEGIYNVKMVGQTKNGKIINKDTTVHMVLWNVSKREEGMRFSVIFEFDESKSINIYDKYLTDIIIPKIPKGATVIISGYTDIIGEEEHNIKLSLARTDDVRNVLQMGLAKADRTDVKFETYGFGQDELYAPFANKYPEERFYNRTVIIDIIPKE